MFRRLEEYDGQQVSYWYEDHKTQASQHTTLPGLRFIGRMVQHLLPNSFPRIRDFGLHSHPRYQTIREQLATLLPSSPAGDPRGCRVLPRAQFAQLFFSTFGRDPLLCPRCGTPMEWELLDTGPPFEGLPPFGRSALPKPDTSSQK